MAFISKGIILAMVTPVTILAGFVDSSIMISFPVYQLSSFEKNSLGGKVT
jgi:hypothetical protein